MGKGRETAILWELGESQAYMNLLRVTILIMISNIGSLLHAYTRFQKSNSIKS